MKKILSVFLILIVLSITTIITFAEDSSICGIGVNLQKKNTYDSLTIVDVFDNSPAQNVGLRGGDKVIKIDDKNTENMTLQDAGYSIRGKKGTSIKLLVLRDGNQKTYIVKRDTFKIPVIAYAPRWSEFCPSDFVDAEYNDIPQYRPAKNDKLIAMSIIGLPHIWSKHAQYNNKVSYIQKANYWTQRRMIFDNEIKTCAADEKNATNCFMQVRQLENARNTELQNQLIARMQLDQQAQSNLYSVQNLLQMQQMNTNLNGINNNLNIMQMQMMNPPLLNRGY